MLMLFVVEILFFNMRLHSEYRLTRDRKGILLTFLKMQKFEMKLQQLSRERLYNFFQLSFTDKFIFMPGVCKIKFLEILRKKTQATSIGS